MSDERDRLEQAKATAQKAAAARVKELEAKHESAGAALYAGLCRAAIERILAGPEKWVDQPHDIMLRLESYIRRAEALERAEADNEALREQGRLREIAYEDLQGDYDKVRAERERGLRIAHELTPETQTVEEACASLVDLVRKARAERDRLRDGKLWLVWSIEHGCWWATDSLGYRGTVEAAGRYTLAEAVRISRLRSPFVDRYGKSHRAEMPIPSPELCALFGVDWDGRALASGEESREPASAEPAEEPAKPSDPPKVCTGTGTIPTDFMPMRSSLPTDGRCGICGQLAPIMAGPEGVLAVHPWPTSAGPAEEPGR